MKRIDFTVNGFIFQGNKILLIYHKNHKMWLGVGGHLEDGETPDSQLMKEVKEETALNVEVLDAGPKVKISDHVVRNCPTPFHADLHGVGDHLHYAQYYVCTIKDKNTIVTPEKREFEIYKWFTEEEVANHHEIWNTTKSIVKAAFKFYRSEN